MRSGVVGGPAGVPAAPQYLPFMLAVKGQLRTVELSLLRNDQQNLFLSKPESAPPIEQKWRVAPLRWSAEREPFCILTHRETSRLRLVVAKPDSACELWPVMFSSDKPDGGIVGCSLSPSRSKLVSFMHNGGLFLLAIEKGAQSGGGEQIGRLAGAVLQINAPQEPWVCVRDIPSTAPAGEAEWDNGKRARVTPFYHRDANGMLATYMLVQEDKLVEVRQIVDPAKPWVTCSRFGASGPSGTSRVLFVYCKLPPQLVTADTVTWPLAVFALWIDGCNMFLAQVHKPDAEWELLCSVPVPPHSRLGSLYVAFLPEPLIVTSSTDPHYVGSVAVRRLFLAERLLGLTSQPPRVIRYMQVPALPAAARDLTADLPVTDLPFREFVSEFVGKRLPYDLTPPNIPVTIPPPPKAPSHGPIPLLVETLTGGAMVSSLQQKQRLDWIDGVSSGTGGWKITPLRWAPGREVLFVVMQSTALKLTRVAIAAPDRGCDEWVTQHEFSDATVPFSECDLIPFQYQTVPGSSDLFVLVLHKATRKGGVFFVANPKSEWQFIREIAGEESAFFEKESIRVLYHRSKDALSVNLCTLFVLSSSSGGSQMDDSSEASAANVVVRVLLDPNQPTFNVTPPGGVGLPNNSSSNSGIENLSFLYTFSPKPPVTHVWPCEVFAVYTQNSVLHISHIPTPDSVWRPIASLQIPTSVYAITPVYLPYLAEPLLLIQSDSTTVDLFRLNLIEALSETPAVSGPKFLQRYYLTSPIARVIDTTLDTGLVWIPQMGLQGMHPYCAYPLPFEKQDSGNDEKNIDEYR